jgi:hypothetical protein
MADEVSPIRAEIDRLRASEALKSPLHPSHEAALTTLSRLYAAEYKEDEPAKSEEVEATKAVHQDALKVDNPQEAAEQAALQPLRQEWAGQWDANIEAAQGVVESLSKDLGYDVADFLEDSRLGSHPTVIKSMWSWSRGEPGPDISAAEARSILDMARKSELYQKGDSRARDTLLDVVQALYRVVHPEA